ncbi:type VI secretion system baseplate subunit TssE [Noviherbaspirillum aerium]|uniref:type VI secretion system baseplate subunit TssE n=1 Tax=Noviherbaspirillum aerium TaxID=2588497 RepID=UPI00124F48AE|nr:type VI secretion system baseplate subunit TssE [Noviherbaspirillum aerium]
MNKLFGSKAKYRPTLLDRLSDNAPRSRSESDTLRQITAEEIKDSVARDLEALLNSRCAMNEQLFKWYPESLKSICSYGMGDFVGRSLANPADRNHICRSLERTIAIHERRLKQIQIALDVENHTTNRLRFTIHALLVVHPSMEPVHFDALLHPATSNYSVTRTNRSVTR